MFVVLGRQADEPDTYVAVVAGGSVKLYRGETAQELIDSVPPRARTFLRETLLVALRVAEATEDEVLAWTKAANPGWSGTGFVRAVQLSGEVFMIPAATPGGLWEAAEPILAPPPN